MTPADLAAELGLNRPPDLWRDGRWWSLAAAGALVAVLLWSVSGTDPRASLPHGPWQWCGVLLWQPLWEEMLFRGLIQGQLLKSGWGRTHWRGLSAANLVSALAFAATHFLYHPPLWAASVLVPSLVFGWLRDRYRNTWPCIVMHVLYNSAFFLGAAIASL